MHSIENLMITYYNEFSNLKKEHSDLSNLSFHNDYGLSIRCPNHWPLLDAIGQISIDAVDGSRKTVLIIYDSTETYTKLMKKCSPNTVYVSWQEIFVGMSRNDNPMLLKHIKQQIHDSDVVFFIGTNDCIKEVVAWVKNFCSSCLILTG